jgi:hypothetical protein
LAAVEGELARLVDAVATIGASQALAERTRAILADLLGQVTVVHEGREVFAELEDPAQRLLLAAGGSAESLGGVAGARNSSRRLRRVRLA